MYMNRKIILALGVIIVISGVIFFLSKSSSRTKNLLETTELGFPMRLVNDQEFSEFYKWKGQVLISVNDYSKENLEKIFAWYSSRHPKGTIMLYIYTNEEDLDKIVPTGIPADPSAVSKEPSRTPSNASYIRDDRDGSEYYGYDLDPVKKDKQENVFLKLTPYKK
jgi:hypothetical protein